MQVTFAPVFPIQERACPTGSLTAITTAFEEPWIEPDFRLDPEQAPMRRKGETR